MEESQKNAPENRKNNFDFLRLVFAIFVIITHAYPLSGIKEDDFLQSITNQQISFSAIGVKGFFIISGFLIFKSMLRSRYLIDYYWKRVLRLFPALIFVLLLTVLLAPFVYQSQIDYLKNPTVFTYFFNNISLYNLQYNIEGVFQNNPYKSAINGSLWTICYEFTMYIIVSCFFFTKKNSFLLYILILGFIISHILLNFYPKFFNGFLFQKIHLQSYLFYELNCYFLAGSILSFIDFKKIKIKEIIIFISIILTILSILFNILKYTGFLLFPILIIFFGISSTKYINKVGEKIGDTSYGIYIYAFPVQQTLMYFFNFNYIQLMIATLPTAFLLGFISWHLIEKQALKFKDLFIAKS